MHSPGLRSRPPEKCSHPKMLTKKRMAGTDQDITIIVITCTVDSVKMNPCDEEMKILDSDSAARCLFIFSLLTLLPVLQLR